MNGNQRSDQVMTMEREGCTCKGLCCGGIKQGLGCFACYPCCQDGMRLHAGKLQNQPHEPGANPQDKLIGAAQVPKRNGMSKFNVSASTQNPMRSARKQHFWVKHYVHSCET